ncbi:unnamed protein product [Candidula unifasciata]|uniref:PH domain-containing protein n=1 Tax=Candidula unifasciata TaxID=100452 RepID=A0A8S4A5N7_9EUPU|nr:unnamed protein product [Candidula unifasciata]
MRFNARELAIVVQQTTNFDKEGYLFMKEKHEGFFKKSEAYVNRYIRLKGNLLFYFKSKDSRADPLGVIVLERCAVELAVDEDVNSGFLLVFEGEEQAFRFGASTEAMRDEWIQALHIASHECLKMQLQSLREQLQTKTGNDIVHLPVEPSSTVDFESQTDNTSQDPVLEISIACCSLPNDSSDVPPNALVVVHTMLPPQQQIWMHHNHTEIVEKSNNPQFLKTIGFGDKFGIDTATKVRLTVHHVVERMTGTMTQIGQAIFTLQDLLMSNDLSLTLTLRTHDLKDKGTITVTSWINDERVSLNELQTQQSGTYSKRPRTFSLGRHQHNLQAHFNDIIKRSFRFATNDEKSMIQVSEYMAESKWTFEIPIQLLQLWVNEEKQMISLLQDLGELFSEWEEEQLLWIKLGADTAVCYNNALEGLASSAGVTFKRSADRGKQELEFVPANLHVERMVVSSDHAPSGKVYDITTVGAFTTHCRDMKNGGLKRLMHTVRSSYAPEESSQPRAKMQQACRILNEVTELRTQLRSQCEKMLLAAELENTESVVSIIASMKEKVARLNSMCAEPLVESAAESYLSAKRNANTGEGCDSSSLKNIQSMRNPVRKN